MKTEHKLIAGVATVLGLAWIFKPKRSWGSGSGSGSSSGSGAEGGAWMPGDTARRRAFCKFLGMAYDRSTRMCVRPPKPIAAVFVGYPTTPKPLPKALLAALCSSPDRLEPEYVGRLLVDVVMPAWRKSTGGEIGPSESALVAARDAVTQAIYALCPSGAPLLPNVASYFYRAAEAIDSNIRYGPALEAETATGTICNWTGNGYPLRTGQVLSLLIDVGIDGARRNQSLDTITARMIACTQRPAPVSATAAYALGRAIARVAIAVREAT